MATIHGEAGCFLKERAIRRRLNGVMVMFLLMSLVFFILGFVTARMSLWWLLAAVAIIFPAYKIFERFFDKQICMARADEIGASGEREIACYLKELPNTYTVINDLSYEAGYGNIDHLVIGQTGVFAIDVKNWKGTVSADGKGELLINGKPTDKPCIKNFTHQVMDLKDRIYALTKLDPYVQCVFVFPHTQLEAKWGATGAVHCINAENITDYIIKFRPVKQLLVADIPLIVSAIDALKKIAK